MSRTNESYFHESWLGMVRQDGLVVSVPVLSQAGLMVQRGAGAQRAYRQALLPPPAEGGTTSQAPLATKPRRRKSRDPLAEAEQPTLELPSLEALVFELLEFTE